MRKPGYRAFTRVAAMAVALTASGILASAQTGSSTDLKEDPILEDSPNKPLVNEELANDLGEGKKPGDSVEAPPPAEYPYPGAAEDGYKASAPKKKNSNFTPSDPILEEVHSGSSTVESGPDTYTIPDDSTGSATGKTTLKRRPGAIAQPKAVAHDGSYIYSTELETPEAHPAPGMEPPTKTDKMGQYFYKPIEDENGGDTGGAAGVERPITITSKGQYVYKVNRTRATAAASVRFGMMSPPNLINSEVSSIKFTDIYGTNSIPVVFADYEWRITNKVGRLSLKFTTGISSSSGTGQFETDQEEGRPSKNALEKFTFINFPNQLTANYKFQYADNQIFVPYIEGGLGYFTFTELRNDDKGPKFGAAPVAVAAAGGSILLDWIDKRAIHQLDASYGVSHVWLTAEYRQVVGLEKSQDFTSSIFNVGFMMEF